MLLTERDIKLMSWLNGFGYAQIQHIATWMGITPKTAYRRMHKLVNAGYCQHQPLWFGEQGVYRLTTKGAEITNDELPELRGVNLAQAKHQLAVIGLSLKLEKQSAGQFIPERQLRRCLGLTGVGQATHVCDGIWVYEDKQIAIEVELTTKGARRVNKIIKHYKKSVEYAEVWYFCGNAQVKKKVSKAANEASFIKVHDLEL